MIVNLETIQHLWPETVLVILAIWILVAGSFWRVPWWWTSFAVGAYAVTTWIICRNELSFLSGLQQDGALPITGPVMVDNLGFVLRLLAIVVGGLFTLIAAETAREELASEFVSTLMLLVVGVMLVARANDLVLLFVGLELVSVCTYVLLYLGRRDRATAEATAKYFFLSILSSAVLLYGLSFLYGLAGTTTLLAPDGMRSIGGALARLPANSDGGVLGPLALVLVVAGIGFKLAAVPFHFYAPDVYQGATHGNAGLLAIAPKIAGLAALIRVVVAAMPVVAGSAWQVILVMAVASMTLGNVCALWQTSLRRLMAFSSIAHAGYLLMGIAVALRLGTGGDGAGVGAALLYVIVYALASAGVFAAWAYLGGVEREVQSIEDLSGLGRTHPVAGAALATCLLSLAGIPPLAGFWGKLTLFFGALTAGSEAESGTWFVVLAAVGALNAAVGAAYYLRVIGAMYFGEPKREFGGEGGWGAHTAMVAATLLTLLVGLFPGSLVRTTRQADVSLHRAASHSAPAVAAVPLVKSEE